MLARNPIIQSRPQMPSTSAMTLTVSLAWRLQYLSESAQYMVEAFEEGAELPVRHVPEQKGGERSMAAVHLGQGRGPSLGERDESGTTVGGVRLAGDQAGGNQPVDQTGHVARGDLQGVGERPLRGGAPVVDQPHQTGPRHGQSLPDQGLSHVLAEEYDKLQEPVERFDGRARCIGKYIHYAYYALYEGDGLRHRPSAAPGRAR